MSSAPELVLPELIPRNFDKLNRDELVERLDVARGMRRAWIRKLVIEKNRVDILARILGYDVAPHHLQIAQFQFKHVGGEYLILAPRGFGKTIIATIVKTIHLLIKRPEDIRILLSSKTAENAKGMLNAIKMHLEQNERFRYFFGNFVGNDEWGSASITVRQRTKALKESTIETVGVEGTIVSRHFDLIIGDDLVDEKNAKTERQRKNVETWYYKVLLPCLEPPSGDFEHRGEMAVIGTRYHFADLYGHLIDGEMKGAVYHLPALINEEGKADVKGRSAWEEKFSTEELLKRRAKMGNIIFAAQMLNDVEAMKGEIFSYDDCRTCRRDELPRDLEYFVGVDLAIKQKEESDNFSIIVLGFDRKASTYYVVDYFEGKLRFSAQTKRIIDAWKEWDASRIGIETNSYQEAQLQNLQDADRSVPVFGLHTGTDKVSRAWRLTPLFESGRVVFLDHFQDLIEKFVKFPNTSTKDWFDAFDLAYRASTVRKRKKRREIGLI